jgi:HlyD family secretion protein
MKSYFILLISLAIFASCSEEERAFDASGVFEATEIIVSSEANGKILSFSVGEGESITKDAIVCQIDSTQLKFALQQIKASKTALLKSKPNMEAQIDATKQEIAKQEYEKKRIEKLLAGDVATQKQLDDIDAMLTILKARLRSQKSSLNTSIQSINAQAQAMDVQIAQVKDQISRCKIKSPITGTVLVKYAEQGEMTGIAKPLFKLADVNNMILRAYVTAEQLADLQIGQDAKVFSEYGESELKEYAGKVIWISSKSEFTPKTIQTQDERANLVYAVKLAVPNDGYLKIGMYGGFKISE